MKNFKNKLTLTSLKMIKNKDTLSSKFTKYNKFIKNEPRLKGIAESTIELLESCDRLLAGRKDIETTWHLPYKFSNMLTNQINYKILGMYKIEKGKCIALKYSNKILAINGAKVHILNNIFAAMYNTMFNRERYLGTLLAIDIILNTESIFSIYEENDSYLNYDEILNNNSIFCKKYNFILNDIINTTKDNEFKVFIKRSYKPLVIKYAYALCLYCNRNMSNKDKSLTALFLNIFNKIRLSDTVEPMDINLEKFLITGSITNLVMFQKDARAEHREEN